MRGDFPASCRRDAQSGHHKRPVVGYASPIRPACPDHLFRTVQSPGHYKTRMGSASYTSSPIRRSGVERSFTTPALSNLATRWARESLLGPHGRFASRFCARGAIFFARKCARVISSPGVPRMSAPAPTSQNATCGEVKFGGAKVGYREPGTDFQGAGTTATHGFR